jgi:hypothetical protein
MDLLAACRTYAGGLALVTGAACAATTDSGRGRSPDSRSSNPLEPPPVCTLIGCEDGLTVELRPPTSWPSGDYLFRIRVDATDVTCRGSIPLADCGGSRGASPGAGVTCDPDDVVRIAESGCASPAAAQGFPVLSFAPALRPRSVEIAITRDGRVVGGATVMPSFREVRPNGPDCPPTCQTARAVLDLDLSASLSAIE